MTTVQAISVFAGSVAIALAPSVTLAQVTPYKLVISWYQSNLTVLDYPTKGRCEAAASAVNDEVVRRFVENLKKLPPGSVPVGTTPNGAFCIPG